MVATPYSVVCVGGVRNTHVIASDPLATLGHLYRDHHGPTELTLSLSDYTALSPLERKQYKLSSIPYFVGGVLHPLERSDRNVQARTLLTMDIERRQDQTVEPPLPEHVVAKLRALGASGWVYTSLSHTASSPRYRVVLPLQYPLTGPDCTTATLTAHTEAAAHVLGVDLWLDTVSGVLSQPMFLPVHFRGSAPGYQAMVEGLPWQGVEVPAGGGGLEQMLLGNAPRPAGLREPADIPDGRGDQDPVLAALKRAGLYLGSAGAGRHNITCPWHEQHGSPNSGTQTQYMQAHHCGYSHPAVKCMDTEPDIAGSGAHLTMRTLRTWLKQHGHLGAADLEGDLITGPDRDSIGLGSYQEFKARYLADDLITQPIPPREWAIHRLAPVGKVTVLAGPGGVSKSMFMLTVLVHASMGLDFAGLSPAGRLKSLFISYEDDRPEMQRRLHQVMNDLIDYNGGVLDVVNDVHGSVKENLGIFSVEDDDVTPWILLDKPERYGVAERTARVDWLAEHIKAEGIKLLVVDPAVCTHRVEENNTSDMSMYMQTLTRLASRGDCAVVVIHHVNKAGGWAQLDDIDQGALRGASAIADHARSVVLLVSMPLGDAAGFGLPLDASTAGLYAVLKHVKHNYSAPIPPTVFERSGALLRHRPEIRRMSGMDLYVAKETARAVKQQVKTETHGVKRAMQAVAKEQVFAEEIHNLIPKVLETLRENQLPVSGNQLRDQIGCRKELLIKAMELCTQECWVEITEGLRGAKMVEITEAGRREVDRLGGSETEGGLSTLV